jgi:hypothetical protein
LLDYLKGGVSGLLEENIANSLRRQSHSRVAFEITDFRTRHLLALHRARVKAHARHIKASPFLLDLSRDSR